ncbi:helix-turn-helix domain-containing protein [Marinilactibacillus psychrotolerans]|uniref:helix-turn-helix domain-containing protein n=1 Tax=Marinilactibacillus psychrotolerans TaxID=191770 RepID=UPI003885A215
MTLSDEFYDYLKEIEGEDFTLNHIHRDDKRIEKLNQLATKNEKDGKYRRCSKKLPKTVEIITRGTKFYDFEDVDWEAIRKNRIARKINQKEMACLVGMAKTMYQQYESGRTRISKKWIEKICKVLNLQIEEKVILPVDKRGLIDTKAIRKKRLILKMSQKEVALKAGVSQGAYCDYERGKKPWSPRVLSNACKVLGIDYEDIME